jgi:hypothetical protein
MTQVKRPTQMVMQYFVYRRTYLLSSAFLAEGDKIPDEFFHGGSIPC